MFDLVSFGFTGNLLACYSVSTRNYMDVARMVFGMLSGSCRVLLEFLSGATRCAIVVCRNRTGVTRILLGLCLDIVRVLP